MRFLMEISKKKEKEVTTFAPKAVIIYYTTPQNDSTLPISTPKSVMNTIAQSNNYETEQSLSKWAPKVIFCCN